MLRRLVSCSLILLTIAGCGSKEPYRSGGRTAAYWAEALQQPDVELRRKAAVKIGPLMLTDEDALRATLAALKDSDAKVRLAAIRALKIYATAKAVQVIPALRELREKDPEEMVRQAAGAAVEALANR